MTSKNNKFMFPVTALVSATIGAGAMFIINEIKKTSKTNQKDGITIITNGFNKFIPDNDFQSFFELSVSRGHVNDYSILEYAIRRDYNNLQHLRDSEFIFPFVKIALDQDIQSLEYCKRISNQIILNKVINYAKELYGDSVYDYIEHPKQQDD